MQWRCWTFRSGGGGTERNSVSQGDTPIDMTKRGGNTVRAHSLHWAWGTRTSSKARCWGPGERSREGSRDGPSGSSRALTKVLALKRSIYYVQVELNAHTDRPLRSQFDLFHHRLARFEDTWFWGGACDVEVALGKFWNNNASQDVIQQSILRE